jgi:hypothetical protein
MSEENPVVDDECSASNGLGLLPPPQAGEGTLGREPSSIQCGQVGGEISLSRRDRLGLLPPPLAGEGWGEGD